MKILYTPPRGLGDMIFSLPLLHSLKNAYPDSQIYVPIPDDDVKKQILNLIGFIRPTPRYLPLPNQDPLASERRKASIARDTKKKYYFEKLIFDKYLNGESYDLSLVPKTFRIDTINCDTQVTELDLKRNGFNKKELHMVDRFLEFANYLGIERVLSFELDFDKTKIPVLLSGRQIKNDRPYILFSLGASTEDRKWTSKGYSEVSDFCDSKGYDVILVGTGSEADLARKIKRAKDYIHDTVPETGYSIDLENFARLAFNAKAVLSGDTGFTHIADAIGTNVVGLFGPGSPKKYAPYNNRKNIISRYDIDKSVRNIRSKDVISKLEELI